MRFRSKERGTRVKDRAKNGKSKKGERGWGREEGNLPSPPPLPSFIFWLSFHFSRRQNRSFFAPKPNGNACYAGYQNYCIVCLRISAQKLVLISCRVARTYVSVSDRRVSHRFLMRLTIGLILTCACRLGAVPCQNSQKGVGKDRLQ